MDKTDGISKGKKWTSNKLTWVSRMEVTEFNNRSHDLTVSNQLHQTVPVIQIIYINYSIIEIKFYHQFKGMNHNYVSCSPLKILQNNLNVMLFLHVFLIIVMCMVTGSLLVQIVMHTWWVSGYWIVTCAGSLNTDAHPMSAIPLNTDAHQMSVRSWMVMNVRSLNSDECEVAEKWWVSGHWIVMSVRSLNSDECQVDEEWWVSGQ